MLCAGTSHALDDDVNVTCAESGVYLIGQINEETTITKTHMPQDVVLFTMNRNSAVCCKTGEHC